MQDNGGALARADGSAAGFRADIEGLRGVSVIAVVLYHAFPQWLTGGFTGVDVFFVISGYLITRLLMNELGATGRIDLIGFWQRRIRRILPAATFVLLAIALAVLLIPAMDARVLGRHIAAAALFYHNIRQAWSATDYLGADHKDNPLLHYWSLSVEEQFYLVWPLVLVAAVYFLPSQQDRRWKLLAGLAAVLLAASLTYSIHLTARDPSWAFFGTPSRSWQLLCGALLAIVEPHVRYRHGGSADAVSLLSLGVLIGCFALISDAVAYPGLAACAPTFATAALIYFNTCQNSHAATLLGNAPLRFVGRVSFSWYLWHWPLLVFARLLYGDTLFVILSAVAISFVLAVITYALVERPVRHAPVFATSPRHAYGLGAVLIVSGLVAGIGMRHLAPDGIHTGGGVYVSSDLIRKDRARIYSDRCHVNFVATQSPPCAYGAAEGRATVVLVGDSHAANWFEPLDAAARQEGWRLVVRTKSSCRPIDTAQIVTEGGRPRPYHECSEWLQRTLSEIKAMRPKLIVVAGTGHNLDLEAETRVIRSLAAVGRTVVMRDTPWLPVDPLKCLRIARSPDQCQWPLAQLLASNAYPRTKASDLPANARIVDLNRDVCPGGTCNAVLDGQVVMFDEHHLTASFGRRLAGKFRELLAAADN
ncbi:MAG: hypothetical protein RLZ98_1480 [Pseudomonadota bacterium]